MKSVVDGYSEMIFLGPFHKNQEDALEMGFREHHL